MGNDVDPGARWVTETTRRFELVDQRVSKGAGRGPTAAEAAAAERERRRHPVSDRTRRAYRNMVLHGKCAQGAGRIDP